MLTRQRRFKKRKTFRGRRVRRYTPDDYPRRPGTGRIPRLFPMAVKTFKQTYIPQSTSVIINGQMSYSAISGGLTGPSTTATGDGFFSIFCVLADVLNQAAFSALFDQYRIDKWRVNFYPLLNNISDSNASGGNPSGFPEYLQTVIDRDDASLLVGNAAMQYDTFLTTPPWEKCSRGPFCPNMQVAVNQEGTFSGVGFNDKFPYENAWIDAANSTVSHYGVKGKVASANTAANNLQAAWYVQCEVWISLRNTR